MRPQLNGDTLGRRRAEREDPLLEDIADHFRRLANPPASPELLARAQRAFGQLARDVLEFYARMNGTREMTPLEQGAIRFWSLSEWAPLADVMRSDLYEPFAEAPIVADHMIESWWYVLDCRANSPTAGSVLIVDGLRPPALVARNFNDFLLAVQSDDESLYPRN